MLVWGEFDQQALLGPPLLLPVARTQSAFLALAEEARDAA